MAKPKPGGRRPRKKERKNVTYGVAHIKSSFNNTIVTITDPRATSLVGLGRQRRVQGLAQVHAVRRPDGRRAGGPRAMEHGVRKVDVLVKGPGSGRETAIRSIQNTGIEVSGIKDVTPGAAQRLPPAQASEGLTGSLHRPRSAGSAAASG